MLYQSLLVVGGLLFYKPLLAVLYLILKEHVGLCL